MIAVAGTAALDGFGLHGISANVPTGQKPGSFSRDIRDYPHIIDAIPSRDMKTYFPLIVEACTDPQKNYLENIPFLIELEVCKIWSESRFEWDALSNVGAGGLQQLMPGTARDFGLKVAKNPEMMKLDSAIDNYQSYRSKIAEGRQDLHNLVETCRIPVSSSNVTNINKIRKSLDKLYVERKAAYNKLKYAKSAYTAKINSMSEDKRKDFDARFVPKILIPAGIEHIYRDVMECKKHFGGPVEMNVWRGVAAYNSGLERTKKWEGLPYIQETVHFTRGVISDLTRTLELKYAYSTKNTALIANTKRRMGTKAPKPYTVYVVKPGDCFYEIVREQIMDRYKLTYSQSLSYIKDDRGKNIDPDKMSCILPNQSFRIYKPR
ncbi:transglycosylase SLT domain-containing protein [Candidatus Poribacteria bacterium]|nr:transglycosylase SLT domain-containing protein [Candidatus Poribacteria bacterium]